MSNKWIIKDADGNITNPCVLADETFVQSMSEHYELWVDPAPVEPTAEEAARQWRDGELARTDIAATVSDYPNAEAVLTYRQALRDWPATDNFPETRPTLGE